MWNVPAKLQHDSVIPNNVQHDSENVLGFGCFLARIGFFFDPSDNGYPYVGCTVGDNYSNSMTQFYNTIRQSTEDQCVYASPQAGRQCVWGLELHTPAAIYAMECNIRADIKSPTRLIFDMYVDSITIIFRWYFLRRLLRQE